jgi:cytochrome c biogenesis protein CcdA
LFFAFSLLFPQTYVKILSKITSGKLKSKFERIAVSQSNKKSNLSAIILGASLGPIFAACSPTYFIILSTVLPASFGIGLLNLLAYSVGLALVMFLVAFAGQKVMSKLNVSADPNGWFKKVLGILFLIVGVGIMTGYDKELETYILEAGYFDVTGIEQKILEDTGNL